jgi:hypothetical protein
MDRKTKSRRDRILEHLTILRIPITAAELDHVLDVVEREGLSTLEAIDRLLGEPRWTAENRQFLDGQNRQFPAAET